MIAGSTTFTQCLDLQPRGHHETHPCTRLCNRGGSATCNLWSYQAISTVVYNAPCATHGLKVLHSMVLDSSGLCHSAMREASPVPIRPLSPWRNGFTTHTAICGALDGNELRDAR
ncbi:hypothetical protein BO99DRAFT_262394 [Aspergillus violaceofuscus CBS 115571]|uniref:Uncharacterized protein n=1 Tax=Aspergillus violaceofuscus (strain CBS 115571) TaxID=1450538 RepID=A0A2V5H2U0_ASPV1|nr:hypothetical protein BO99DRAFT_262394 [Aspergillus violaceofuscus CBS 115571]